MVHQNDSEKGIRWSNNKVVKCATVLYMCCYRLNLLFWPLLWPFPPLHVPQ